MKEEKQTGIVSGNPYREAGIVSAERKLLSEQQAKTLVDIVSSNKDFCIPQLTFGKKSYSFTEMLRELGYEKYLDRGKESPIGLHIKSGNFYFLVSPPHHRTLPVPVHPKNVSLVSGATYGNMEEVRNNSIKYLGLCGSLMNWNYAFYPSGIIKVILGPLLNKIESYAVKRNGLEAARRLPVEFASYQYGLEARAKLRDEFKQLLKTK